MSLSLYIKRLSVIFVSIFIFVANLDLFSYHVNAEEADDEPYRVSEGITWEVSNNSDFERLERINHVESDLIEDDLIKPGTVRVSIILDENSMIDAGYSAQAISKEKSARAYRAKLVRNQHAMEKKISSEALRGKTLDVKWNLTLAGNIISANVPYSRIAMIKSLDGVKDVVIENCYEASDPVTVNDPNMAIATVMTGTNLIASEYTGAGQTVAIIDTGIDTDHRSFDPEAFDYAIENLDKETDLLTADDVAAVFDQLNASQFADGLTAADTYVNSKIPFGFNYVDKNLDITHDNDQQGGHGSHVAGIAAANRYVKNTDGDFVNALDEVKTQGQAPDAQILAMKVFGKSGGAYDSDLFAAIEDAMILGAASANLSLGSANPGYISNDTYTGILNRFTEEDTVITMSMGNSYSWPYASKSGHLYSDDVSFDTAGSPGSYTNAFTVASVDNDGIVGKSINAYGNNIFYDNGSGECNSALETLSGEYSYIAIDGFGTQADMAALANVLEGKIAVVSRGEIDFSLKAQAAVENGAVATIIYNDQPGIISMDLAGYVYSNPAISITKADGQFLKNNAVLKTLDNGTEYYEGILSINNSAEIQEGDAEYHSMSDFSSWGTTGDLNLKPEITAPGGNIYSVNGKEAGGQAYELMSGTSMAAPQIAGLTALMHQYITENDLENRTGLTEHQLTQSLLMSTAKPLLEERSGGNYYSILKQGAGLANIAEATNAKSFITVAGTAVNGESVEKSAYKTSCTDGKVKAMLGEDAERNGLYTVTFNVTNFSDEEVDYSFDADMFTQNILEGENEYLDESTIPLDAVVNFIVNGEDISDPDDTFMFDFNDDGVFNAYDAVALLEYVVGTREYISDIEYADIDMDGDLDTYDAYLTLIYYRDLFVTAEPGETLTVTAMIDLNGSMDDLGSEERNGNYVEGYLFVAEKDIEDGAIGAEHSIPVLGYFGSWSEASMTDKGSYLEFIYEEEYRDPYMVKPLGEDAYQIESFNVNYAADSELYHFGGNPYVQDETYHPERNAINAKDTLANVMYSQIRNAGSARFTAEDEDGNLLFETVFGPSYSAYYHVNKAAWQNTSASTSINYQPNRIEENTKLTFTYTMAPEYYIENGETDWEALKDGAAMRIEAVVDNTAPELVGDDAVALIYNERQTEIEVTVRDNQYVAAVYLFGEHAGEIGVYGAEEDAAAGETKTYRFPLDQGIESHLYLDICDYACNETIYRINLDPDELFADVAVELDQDEYSVLVNNSIKATATVSPWGINDSVTWSTEDESIAVVDEEGIITGISAGETTVTAISNINPAASATANVFVKAFDTDLNGIVWDENGEVYFSEFNTDDLLGYSKLSGPMRLPLASAAYDQNGKLYAASFDQDTWSSVLYTIDETDYSVTEIGSDPGGIAYMDICKAPSLGDDILLAVYGPYVLIVDASTGAYIGAFNNTNYISGNNLVGIAYEEQYKHSRYGNTDWVWLIDDAGVLYECGYLFNNGKYSRFAVTEIGQITKPVDTSYFQSLYYDGEHLFFSRFNNTDNKVELVAVENPGSSFEVWSLGCFQDSVWPVCGLYEQGVYNVGISSGNASSVKADAVIESVAQKEVARIVPENPSSEGSVNTVGTNLSVYKVQMILNKAAASTISDETGEFTVTVSTDEDVTNGLYTVAYDPAKVEYISSAGLTKYNAINDMNSGEIKIGFINEEELAADTAVADIKFKLLETNARTEIAVTTIEENNKKTGAADIIRIGKDEEVIYSFVSGDNGTWTKDSEDPLDFCISRSATDSPAADHFVELLIDGKRIDPSNYTVNLQEFSVSLSPSFLATLSTGRHIIRFVFDDGFAETAFTIYAAAPDTSDINNITAWILLMCVTLIIAIRTAYKKTFL